MVFLIFSTVRLVQMGPTEIKKIFLWAGLFTKISKPMKNLELKFGPVTLFDLFQTLNGLDHVCSAHRNQKMKKNPDCLDIPFWQYDRSTVLNFFTIFSQSMHNQAPKFDHLALVGHLKRLNGSHYASGAHRSGDIISYWFDFFFFLKLSLDL